MPELPEVQTIVNDLKPKLSGRKIKNFILLNQKAGLKKSVLNYDLEEFNKFILKQTIRDVQRRAKHILIVLDQGLIAIHLKMTGQLIFSSASHHEVLIGGHPIIGQGNKWPNKFTRAEFTLENGDQLYFNDVRRFGWIRYYTVDEWEIESAKSGVEPLGKDFSLEVFTKILEKKSRVTIKQAIMDAKLLVGVGNIYADESLFISKIKPSRKAGDLSKTEIKKLWETIPKILKLSIEYRGTSFNDYVDAQGGKGNFLSQLKIYGRGGKPCVKCNKILQKNKIGGRGTVWCDHCQL